MPEDETSETVLVRSRIPVNAKSHGNEIRRREDSSQQTAIELFWRVIVEWGCFRCEIKAGQKKQRLTTLAVFHSLNRCCDRVLLT